MIVGPGWAFLGLLAIGIAAVVLLPGCGIVVVDAAPSGEVRLYAPRLVEADASVEARSAAVSTLSLARARRQVRRGALRIRNTGCDGIPTGSGFALGSGLLIAYRDVLPGAGRLRVVSRNGRARTVDAVRVYRLGEFGIARVGGRLPRPLPTAGAPHWALGRRDRISALRAAPPPSRESSWTRPPGPLRGSRTRDAPVLRARRTRPAARSSTPRAELVALAFTTDPRTGLTVAVPVRALRSLVTAGALDALPRCDGP